MVTLPDFLSNWTGFAGLEARLEKKGFGAAGRYRRLVAQQAKCQALAEAERYWEEVSREYVSGAGRTHVESRAFKTGGSYRSPYLDGLASDLQMSGFLVDRPPFLPLLPCLRAFEGKRYSDPEKFIELTSVFEEEKALEAHKYKYIASAWDGTKIGTKKLLVELGVRAGLVVDGQGLVIRGSSGLMLCISYDTGGRPHVSGLQLDFDLTHVDSPEFVFPILWHNVLPGFHSYCHFRSAASAVLGLDANIAIAQFFVDELSQYAEHSRG